MGELGLLGLTKPQENGGSALDWSYAAVLAETLAEIHCGGVPMAIGVQTDMCTPALARHGSAQLRAEFLTPAVKGERVGCLGVSEVGSGSDVASIKTTARQDGGDYVINGGKMWTTNGTQADFCCLLANTSDGAAHRNKSLIVVPMTTPGISVARKIRKMGMHSSDTAQLHFDDVRVPQRYRIGEEGMGFMYQMEQFQHERLWGALNACGSARRAIRDTIAYTAERQVFGRSVLDNQWVHFKLAELQTEVEALHALAWSRGGDAGARRGRHPPRDHGQAQGRPRGARGRRRLPAVLGRHGLHRRGADLAPVPRHAAGLHRRRRRRGDAADPVEVHGHLPQARLKQ